MLQPMGLQRIRHDRAVGQQQQMVLMNAHLYLQLTSALYLIIITAYDTAISYTVR